MIAAIAAWFSQSLHWSAPVFVFPIVLQILQSMAYGASPRYKYEYNFAPGPFLGFLAFLQTFVLLVVVVWICYRGFDAWWGVPVGLFAGVNAGALNCPRGWRTAEG